MILYNLLSTILQSIGINCEEKSNAQLLNLGCIFPCHGGIYLPSENFSLCLDLSHYKLKFIIPFFFSSMDRLKKPCKLSDIFYGPVHTSGAMIAPGSNFYIDCGSSFLSLLVLALLPLQDDVVVSLHFAKNRRITENDAIDTPGFRSLSSELSKYVSLHRVILAATWDFISVCLFPRFYIFFFESPLMLTDTNICY